MLRFWRIALYRYKIGTQLLWTTIRNVVYSVSFPPQMLFCTAFYYSFYACVLTHGPSFLPDPIDLAHFVPSAWCCIFAFFFSHNIVFCRSYKSQNTALSTDLFRLFFQSSVNKEASFKASSASASRRCTYNDLTKSCRLLRKLNSGSEQRSSVMPNARLIHTHLLAVFCQRWITSDKNS